MGFLFPHPPLAPACCRASPARCCLPLFSRAKIAPDTAGECWGRRFLFLRHHHGCWGRYRDSQVGMSRGDVSAAAGADIRHGSGESFGCSAPCLDHPNIPHFATSLPVSGVGASTWSMWLHPMEQSGVSWGPQEFPMPTSPPQEETCTHGLPKGFPFMSCSFPENVSDSLVGGWAFPLSAGVPLFPPQTPSGAMGTISAGASQTLLL